MQVESKLAHRLEAGLKAWVKALIDGSKKEEDVDINMDTEAPTHVTHKLGGDPKFKVSDAENYLFIMINKYFCSLCFSNILSYISQTFNGFVNHL